MKRLLMLFITSAFYNLVQAQDKNVGAVARLVDGTCMIDSIVYSRDDAFLGYSMYDVFLNSQGEVFLHNVDKYITEFGNGRRTHVGYLKKGVLEESIAENIFRDATLILNEKLNEQYSTHRSDQTTATTSFFCNGRLIKSISDYGMKGNDKLSSFYSILDSLNTFTYTENWNSEQLDVTLFENKEIDSVSFFKHLKSLGSYYKNGVSEVTTLRGEQLSQFILCSKKFEKQNPYKLHDYEIVPSKVEQYSMYVYYSDGSKEWVKYDGKRFKKKTYLDFKAPKNLIKKYF